MSGENTGPERGTEQTSPPEAAESDNPPEAAANQDVRGPPPQESRLPESRQDVERGDERRIEVRCVGDAWSVAEDGDQGERSFGSREKAVATARSRASERRALLVLYDEDGRIEEEQDYGTMGIPASPESDVTGPGGTEATHQAEQRSMHRG